MTDHDHHMSNFKDFDWSRFISAPDADLLQKLYIPGLSKAIRYDRSCAYFSSHVLAVAARGFGGLIHNLVNSKVELPKPAVRLLVNEQLDRDDVKHLLATGDQTMLISQLLKKFKNPTEALEKNRLQMLSWLVASGWLEIRVGLMARTNGIAHAKYGIMTDANGNRLAFMGSDNETGQAILENYEELEVRPDWEDIAFVEYYQQRFETLWRGNDPHVEVMPLPEALQQKLIQLAPQKPPKEMVDDPNLAKAAMLWNFIAVSPYLENGEVVCDATSLVDPWPHQQRVVEDTAKAFPAGRLFCDEVGMGKTIEAILTLRRLLNGRGVKRALFLVPAGLLKQWQDELREKGGLIVPRWEGGYLIWPDDRKERKEIADVLKHYDLLLVSREWARLAGNKPLIFNTQWDWVLLDEAHAARRREAKEGEFNSGNLLLDLMRDLQLRRKVHGILLMSATPMQTQPWEPWDLLTTLGVGGRWAIQFNDIREYYAGIDCLLNGEMDLRTSTKLAEMVVSDPEFPPFNHQDKFSNPLDLSNRLTFTIDSEDRRQLAKWLRVGSPLGRYMHRNTRRTLQEYYRMGLLQTPPPRRQVKDIVFEYKDKTEQDCYEAIRTYIDDRYNQLEKEKSGKGFVMTIYRRRASSSPLALRRSLLRRREKLEKFAHEKLFDPSLSLDEEQTHIEDLVDEGVDEAIDPGLPSTPQAAKKEIRNINELIEMLDQLGSKDSKLDRFWEILEEAIADGRPALVFTEYTDTLDYLRDQLQPTYGSVVACYSGQGGAVWEKGRWAEVNKGEIRQRLDDGKIKILVCTDAASEGLNLQSAGTLINYDLPWNPSRIEQRIGRIDRIGQQRSILPIYNLFLVNSVDMRVYQVLRERCGLFEHFVGRMQPVLSLARSALRRILTETEQQQLLLDLQHTAIVVEEDEAMAALFIDSEAYPVAVGTPPVSRKDLETGMEWLEKANGKIRVKKAKNGWWDVRGLGSNYKVSSTKEVLEQYKSVLPLTVGTEFVEKLHENIPFSSRAPLVVIERSSGHFRCVEVRWIKGKEIFSITGLPQLMELIEKWDGLPVAPSLIKHAQDEALKVVQARIENLISHAKQQEDAGLQRQVTAARFRLKREMGRTLRCAGSDLNNIFRQFVQQETNPDGRYHRALRRLMGYPAWENNETEDLSAFVSSLTEEQRIGRIRLGSEIEAALNDPRWQAADG